MTTWEADDVCMFVPLANWGGLGIIAEKDEMIFLGDCSKGASRSLARGRNQLRTFVIFLVFLCVS